MFERNTTIKSETHDNKKGFHIIIKNLDNGEEVVNSVTKAIIGAYAGENQRGGGRSERNCCNLLQYVHSHRNDRGGGQGYIRNEEKSHRGASSGGASCRFAFGR